MKNILLLLTVVLSISSNAQGNLQFNQVLTFEGNLNNTSISPAYTPPAGRVWKIEFSRIKRNTNCTSQDIEVNGVPASNLGNTDPIWVNDQDTIQMRYGCGGAWSYFFSIIEFNVVP
jgi:hypothetical protein